MEGERQNINMAIVISWCFLKILMAVTTEKLQLRYISYSDTVTNPPLLQIHYQNFCTSKKYARRGHLVYLRVDVGVILKMISNKGDKKVH